MLDDAVATSHSSQYIFGHRYMGPILAECCFLLHRHLNLNAAADGHKVLFCARGGLLIRRALELFTKRIGEPMRYATADLMVSRLAAARLAMGMDSPSLQTLLAIEFGGRTCADAAAALSGVGAPKDGEWAMPYEHIRFAKLLSHTAEGQHVRSALVEQAELLRAHFRAASDGAPNVHLVDTGVFGSIAHFLRAGLPEVSLECVLLFRSHYKRSALPLDQPAAIGLVSDCNHYSPWEPRSASRLYWPFFEAFFEPTLPSVRRYRVEDDGTVVSTLETPGWREQAGPPPDSFAHGAFDYVAALTDVALPSIHQEATNAWRSVRRRIVYPSTADVDLMAVHDRGLDFGCDDVVQFGDLHTGEGWRAALAALRASVWPEGELRRQFPGTAFIWHRLLELGRTGTACARSIAKNDWNSQRCFAETRSVQRQRGGDGPTYMTK
jgi:hypothetical protein